MIQITCKANRAQCSRTERLTSGMVGLQCEFVFDDAWNGLAKTAIFVAGKEQRDVLLIGDTCTVPWEVLKLPDYQLMVGVYGTNADGTLAIPTVYANCGGIVTGADPSGDEGEDPTPTLAEQIMAAAGTAVATANAVKAAADAGEFKGEQGPKGDKGDPGQTPDLNDYQRTLITNGAAVGQIVKITDVDESGKPIEWGSVDMPQGSGEWTLVQDLTLTESVPKVCIELPTEWTELYAEWIPPYNQYFAVDSSDNDIVSGNDRLFSGFCKNASDPHNTKMPTVYDSQFSYNVKWNRHIQRIIKPNLLTYLSIATFALQNGDGDFTPHTNSLRTKSAAPVTQDSYRYLEWHISNGITDNKRFKVGNRFVVYVR